MFNFLKKQKPQIIKLKCGREFEARHVNIDAVYHIVNFHDETIITEGNQRKRKVVCVPSGKYWFEEMPPLEEVK